MERIETDRLILKEAEVDDVPIIINYYLRNREFLKLFEPAKSDEFFTEARWVKKIKTWETTAMMDLHFYLYMKVDISRVIGSLSFSQIVSFPVFSGMMGYSMDEKEQGKGYMAEAATAAIRFMFEEKGLHRIYAEYMPTNTRSGKLLKGLGFRVEGYVRESVLINGRWEDNLLTGLLIGDFKPYITGHTNSNISMEEKQKPG